MPNQQAARTNKKNPATTGARKPPASQPAARAKRETQTGTADKSYALISVLYHALQGAETLNQYIEDARRADDEDLASFFEETREAYAERATEAKELLAERLSTSDAREDQEDDEYEEDEEDDEDED
jgi:hypothetical protein